jgi:hypothetical protein
MVPRRKLRIIITEGEETDAGQRNDGSRPMKSIVAWKARLCEKAGFLFFGDAMSGMLL